MSNMRQLAQSIASPSFKVFKDRYELQDQLSKGSFGQVYQVVDNQSDQANLVAKIQDDQDQFKIEVDILNSIK